MEQINQALFCVTSKGNSYLIEYGGDDLFENELLGNECLNDNIENPKDLPKISGLYNCDIIIKSGFRTTDSCYEGFLEITVKNINLISKYKLQTL